MKKWLAVGVVALGTLGLLMMRSPKKCSRGASGGVPRTCTVAAHSKNTGFRVSPVVSIISRRFPKRRLLIFCRAGYNSMEIVNTFQAKVVQSVKGLNEPQGVLYVPGVDKIFVANAGKRHGQSL